MIPMEAILAFWLSSAKKTEDLFFESFCPLYSRSLRSAYLFPSHVFHLGWCLAEQNWQMGSVLLFKEKTERETERFCFCSHADLWLELCTTHLLLQKDSMTDLMCESNAFHRKSSEPDYDFFAPLSHCLCCAICHRKSYPRPTNPVARTPLWTDERMWTNEWMNKPTKKQQR